MSVYTHLTASDINSLLLHYDIGTLSHFKGIEGGVENTNYFIDVLTKNALTKNRQNRYVLTLFEYLPEETLPFFVNFTTELFTCGISVPAPVRDKEGQALHTLKNKPCLISPCFPGRHLKKPSEGHCQQIGMQLANIHLIGQKSSLQQQNQRGISWLQNQVDRLQPLLSSEDAKFMTQQWALITAELIAFDKLPSGSYMAICFMTMRCLKIIRLPALLIFITLVMTIYSTI